MNNIHWGKWWNVCDAIAIFKSSTFMEINLLNSKIIPPNNSRNKNNYTRTYNCLLWIPVGQSEISAICIENFSECISTAILKRPWLDVSTFEKFWSDKPLIKSTGRHDRLQIPLIDYNAHEMMIMIVTFYTGMKSIYKLLSEKLTVKDDPDSRNASQYREVQPT